MLQLLENFTRSLIRLFSSQSLYIRLNNFLKLSSQIESISGTLVLRWVNSQLGRILNWVERAIVQEVKPQI